LWKASTLSVFLVFFRLSISILFIALLIHFNISYLFSEFFVSFIWRIIFKTVFIIRSIRFEIARIVWKTAASFISAITNTSLFLFSSNILLLFVLFSVFFLGLASRTASIFQITIIFLLWNTRGLSLIRCERRRARMNLILSIILSLTCLTFIVFSFCWICVSRINIHSLFEIIIWRISFCLTWLWKYFNPRLFLFLFLFFRLLFFLFVRLSFSWKWRPRLFWIIISLYLFGLSLWIIILLAPNLQRTSWSSIIELFASSLSLSTHLKSIGVLKLPFNSFNLLNSFFGISR